MFGIYSFDSSIDDDTLRIYVQSRNITVEEFIRNNRCDFLRNIGKYPGDYSNEMIYSDINYVPMCHYYEELMKKYNGILNDIKENLKNEIDIFYRLKEIRKTLFINNYKKMLEELVEYLSDSDKKIVANGNYKLSEVEFLKIFFYNEQSLYEECKLEILSEEEKQELYLLYYGEGNIKSDIVRVVKRAREKAAKKYNKQVLEMCTFESNCDISSVEIDKDLSSIDSVLFASFEQEDGIEKRRLLFFDPCACDEESLDVHLRHEIRHSLTSSVKKQEDLNIVKVGNAEYIYCDGKLISVNNEFYNELLTQEKALEKTKESFDKGIYILSPTGSSFPREITSIYDKYLPEFSKISSLLPHSAVVSQIEENNNNLYSFISKDEIKRIEDGLKDYNNLPDDIFRPRFSVKQNGTLTEKNK